MKCLFHIYIFKPEIISHKSEYLLGNIFLLIIIISDEIYFEKMFFL